MIQYHKIQTVFKRDPDNKFKTLLEGQYSLPEFEYLKDNTWVFTEKVDGTNIRIMFQDGYISFGGKTDNADIPSVLLNVLNKSFLPLTSKFKDTFGDAAVCFYGEGYGGKIQKAGATYGKDQRFVLFDVKVGDWWLLRDDVEDIAEKLRIDIVPILAEGTLINMVECAKIGINSTWGSFQAEGIVARPKTEMRTRRGGRLITKIKCRDFST